jgi:hypothetical protein
MVGTDNATEDGSTGETAVALTVAAELTLSVPQATTPPPPPAAETPTFTNTSPPPAPAGTCDQAQFVSETVPDNTVFPPNTGYIKTWRLRNVGTCTWTSSYSLVFDHGDQMGAPANIPLAGAVAPGQEVDLSVNLVTPASPGTYIGYWRLRNTSGALFYTNNTSTFTVQIVVPAPTPTFTATSGGFVIDPGILIPLFPLILPATDFEFNQATISGNSTGNVTVTCPSGSVVVSGGFAAASDLVVYTSSMEGNGWRVYAKNYAGSGRLLNAYAVCLSNTSGTISQQLAQVNAPVGGYGNPVATCPGGSVVTGGGFASSADNLWVYNSSQTGNSWQVYARNLSGSSQLVNAYAICLSGTTGTTSQSGTNVSIAAGGSDGKQYSCPAGIVTGGGFALQDNLIVYNSSMKSDLTGWEAYARNTGGFSRTMNVYATCLTFP